MHKFRSHYTANLIPIHVILNAVKDLVLALKDDLHCRIEILHCVQDDMLVLHLFLHNE
jgi:hypothetical protein